MRRSPRLDRLNSAFTRRITRLEYVATQAAGKSGQDADRAVAFVVIEALSTWSSFTREFYLSCAFVYPKTIGGQHVTHKRPAIMNERDALLHSIRVLKGPTQANQAAAQATNISPRFEPVWHEKRALSDLSLDMSLSNAQSIIAGLSFQTSFFDDLPTVRNFYAHRSFGTARKVLGLAARKYRVTTLAHPIELVNVIFSGRAQTLIQEWLGDMKQIGSAVCQ